MLSSRVRDTTVPTLGYVVRKPGITPRAKREIRANRTQSVTHMVPMKVLNEPVQTEIKIADVDFPVEREIAAA
jgi:hypothetical protein